MKWQSCQPYAPAAFNPKRHPWYPFMFEAELTPRATGMICQWKFPMTLSGIEPTVL